jgi:hypothetical protein
LSTTWKLVMPEPDRNDPSAMPPQSSSSGDSVRVTLKPRTGVPAVRSIVTGTERQESTSEIAPAGAATRTTVAAMNVAAIVCGSVTFVNVQLACGPCETPSTTTSCTP